ncbi:hypothetical protein M426DRAFT_257470 [Hypoxylon sp. CI-4A]|nr:hypothetical protein M426DRAFT_257470 [Hypoxylon sp. CI-4A]
MLCRASCLSNHAVQSGLVERIQAPFCGTGTSPTLVHLESSWKREANDNPGYALASSLKDWTRSLSLSHGGPCSWAGIVDDLATVLYRKKQKQRERKTEKLRCEGRMAVLNLQIRVPSSSKRKECTEPPCRRRADEDLRNRGEAMKKSGNARHWSLVNPCSSSILRLPQVFGNALCIFLKNSMTDLTKPAGYIGEGLHLWCQNLRNSYHGSTVNGRNVSIPAVKPSKPAESSVAGGVGRLASWP